MSLYPPAFSSNQLAVLMAVQPPVRADEPDPYHALYKLSKQATQNLSFSILPLEIGSPRFRSRVENNTAGSITVPAVSHELELSL